MTRLLLIHTGGTISMVPGSEGFEPKAGVAEMLAKTIVRQDMPNVELDISSFDPLIDSANITPASWNRLVDLIADAHESHDGIVITHGTDTLAYSAAALSFALEGLARPVIVTGAMRPVSREGSDAIDNLRSALSAAKAGAPGVRVQFAGRLMAGDRVVKVSSTALDAFREIPQPACVTTESQEMAFNAKRFGSARVAILMLSPGLHADVLDAALASLDGAVLCCYGSGTIPSDPAFQDALSSRIRRGLTVLVTSQCEHGGVRLGEYAAGATLRKSGIVDGGHLTAEAALAKLALMLSDNEKRIFEAPDRQPKQVYAASSRHE